MTFEFNSKNKNQYIQSLVINIVLLGLGLGIQYFFGSIEKSWFSFPGNIYFAIAFLVIFTTIFALFKQKNWINLLNSVPFAIVSVLTLGLLTILLGSIVLDHSHEGSSSHELGHRLGLDNITTTWYFGVIFLCVLVNLWLAILKRSLVFQMKNITFILNHFGLFLVLFAGVLGQGDLARLTMDIYKDKPEWRAKDDNNRIVELPIAMELKKFTIENYPNKLFIIDKEGNSLPDKKPVSFLMEKNGSSQTMLDWKITLVEYLPDAVFIGNKEYAKSKMWGATNAAKVKVENLKTGKKEEQWISAGNFQFPPMTIPLGDGKTLVMAPPEAKEYESKVLIYQKNTTKIEEGIIQVNHPIKVDGWKIYQISYDDKMGKWSELSVVELVHDPWLPLVYVGIFILIAGTLAFMIQNKK